MPHLCRAGMELCACSEHSATAEALHVQLEQFPTVPEAAGTENPILGKSYKKRADFWRTASDLHCLETHESLLSTPWVFSPQQFMPPH